MLAHFFWFEVRYWLRSAMLWIFTAIIALMVFGAVSTDQITIGGALENTYRNAPFVIENYYAFMCLLTLLMITAFVNSSAARDFSSNTHQLVFSTPLRKFDYLAGHYLGATLISVIPMLGVSIGILVAKYMPWVDAERWGPIRWDAHGWGILVFAIPNTFFIAAIIFTIAVLTRSTVTAFIGGLILLTAYAVSQALMTDLRNETLGSLLDPFAVRTFFHATKYWTVADKNHMSIGLTGLLLWNRLIWIAVGGLIFAFGYVRFSFAERASRSKKKLLDEEASAPAAAPIPQMRAGQSFGFGAQWAQFLGTLRVEFWGLVKTTSFIVITVAALLNTIPSLILNASEAYGNSSFPVTYKIIEMVQGSLYLFLISMITYYAGVLIWKERDSTTDEIQDAMPHAEWPLYLAKLIALLGTIFIIQCLAMLAGILVQTFEGYHRYQIGLYVSELLVMNFTLFIFLATLAFFVHVVSPNKYIGYFAFIAFLIVNQFVWRPLHIGTLLVQFGSQPDYTYSDFYGYAPFLKAWLWFTAYWLVFCGILAAGSLMLWQRGRETGWRFRFAEARLRFSGPLRAFAVLMAVAFVGIGAWIFYNTKVLNDIVTEDEHDHQSADYEKAYKKYQKLPQPRITSVKYAIDLYPAQREATMRGDQVIVNKSGQPISAVHLVLTERLETHVDIDGAKLAQDNPRLHYQIYQLSPPMQAGESRHMRFTVEKKTRGFENSLTMREIMPNGTFFNDAIAPQIGYQPSSELENKNKRKKYGLPEKDLMPALERNCTADCMNTYISNNSDWVDVETIISAPPGQTAIAPGSLLRQWDENGRCYSQYHLDHASLNFYSWLSADYKVDREKWNGIDIEVYYLAEHPWNVPKMLRSVRKSFEYYTANYGPYAHKEARIIEFPRIATFAQAFPGTMPYSESIGFIANLKNPDDIDFVYYVVAHEMAHQWWAHQVIGANMQGATLLSETLAQYSALMVMEKEYGHDKMRRFLEYEMDNYLRSRGRELLKERPLERVEGNQGYIHYRKGSVVMYYLKEMIGEEAVNRALRKVLGQYGYAPPPYPVSYALVDALREQTPPNLQYLIKDLFEEITEFSNRTLAAQATKRPDGAYNVAIDVDAHKFTADDKGNETEVPVDDWIEIGAFAKPPKGQKYGKTLHRERIHMKSGRASYQFVVAEEPDKAGIDPFLLLIDRVPSDNLKAVDITR